jgi:hypothetical protein
MKDSIKIAVFYPKEGERKYVDVACEILGNFAIHRSFSDANFFTVTHRGTGFSCEDSCPTIESARHAARMFEGLGNVWNFTDPAHVESWIGKINDDIKLIRALARNGAES